MNMDTLRFCPQCRQPLPANAPEGLCPQCLLRQAVIAGDPGSAPTMLEGGSQPGSARAGDVLRYFGNYELIEEVGVGGMGVVWRARQASLNRIVALKMIRGGMLANAEDVKRFHAEAQAAANLQHPNIVAIHEIGEQDGQHYYSMDFIQGRSLHALCDGKPLEPERAARLLATVAGAVEFAHRAHILHRDLKPHNVMMDAEGVPHLTDFGLAKRMDVDSGMTQTGAIMGSPSYMAPEQAQGRNETVGPRTDVYSLGAILYETLTGRPPFQAATALDTVRQVVDAEPAPPRSVNPGAPADLETICLKCLEKDPARRYASAQEFSDELGRLLRHEPIHARPIGIVGRTVKWARRKPTVAALTGAVALLILALAIGSTVAALRINSAKNDAVTQAHRAGESLARSLFEQARTVMASERIGCRAKALQLIADAVPLASRGGPGVPARAELRSEAVAALVFQEATLVREVRASALAQAAIFDRDGTRVLGLWRRIEDAAKWAKGDPTGMRTGIAVQDISANREVLRIEDRRLLEPELTMSPDGRVLAALIAEKKNSRGAGDRIELRDIDSNTVTHTLQWPAGDLQKTTNGAASRLFFSPDGAMLGAIRNDKDADIVVWNIATGEGRVVAQATGPRRWVAFTPDGRHLVFPTAEQKLTRVTLADGSRLEIALPLPVASPPVMDTSGTHFLITVGTVGKTGARLLGMDWHTGAQAFSIPLDHPPIGAAAFGPDLRIVFGDGPNLGIYDALTGRVTLRIPLAHGTNAVECVAWGGNSKFVTSVGEDGMARRWELPLTPLLTSLRSKHDHRATVAFSPDGKWLAFPEGQKVVLHSRGRENVDRIEVRELPMKPAGGKLPGEIIPLIAFSADSTQIAATIGPEVVLWDLATGAEILRVPAPPYAWMSQLAFDPAGHLLASRASSDGCSIQDATTGKVLWHSPGESARSTATLSRDGRRAIVAHAIQSYFSAAKAPPRLLDVATGRVIADLKHPGLYQPGLTEFSPDGREAALGTEGLIIDTVGSADDVGPNYAPSAIRSGGILWELDQPERFREIPGAGRIIFSHDGKWLVTADGSGTVAVRDRATLAETFRWKVSDSPFLHISLAPDDSILVIGDGKTALQTLDLTALRRELGRLGLDW